MAIYKTLNASTDIISDVNAQEITAGIFSDNASTLTTFFTSSEGDSTASYIDVSQVAGTNTAAEVQFSIAYGNSFGSGSAKYSGASTGISPTRAVYSQYAGLLAGGLTGSNSFHIQTENGHNGVYFLNFKRNRYKQAVDPETFELHISGNMNHHASIKTKLICDGTGTEATRYTAHGHDYYKLFTGSLDSGTRVVKSTTNEYGRLYPDLGVVTLEGDILRSQVAPAFGAPTASENNNPDMGPKILFKHLSSSTAHTGGGYIAAKSSEKLKSTYYFIRALNGEFNFSNNPTFTTGSSAGGTIRHQSMHGDPVSYITTVALYNNTNDLVAVAKLSKPLQKSFSREALIRVKLDY